MSDEERDGKKGDLIGDAFSANPDGKFVWAVWNSKKPLRNKIVPSILYLCVLIVPLFVKHLFEKSSGGSTSSNVVSSNTVNAPLTVQGNNSSNSTTVNNSQSVSQVGAMPQSSSQPILQQFIVPQGSNSLSLSVKNEIVPDSETKKLIERLESKLNNATNDILLTRNDIKLLTKALKDLDERTSALQSLPDGRTFFGAVVGGSPKIADQEFQKGISQGTNYSEAFIHFKLAADSIDETERKVPNVSQMLGSQMSASGKSAVYCDVGIAAWYLHSNALAKEYIEKGYKASKTGESLVNFLIICHNVAIDWARSNNFSNAYQLQTNIIREYEMADKAIQTNLPTQMLTDLYKNGYYYALKEGKTNEEMVFANKLKTDFHTIPMIPIMGK